MIRSIPTVSSYLSHLQTDYVQTSAITAVSSCYTSPRDTISRVYASAALSAGSGGISRPVRRRSTPTATEATSTTVELDSAAGTVRKFYDGINRRDLASVEDLIALNCVYEDLIFSQPFTGREAILDFFKQFIDSISGDLQFAIDEISEEDTSAVGVTWHLEWKGKPFPFSRGCSFYQLDVINGQRQIVFGRDAVEPAIKPGETALATFS
ncbi:uncharacterized protein LOC131010288 isoform X2 [Salvia miltiorrhiza]|uniref:uncharacterized protein LOC131010288 isoform X2 n=1 Tax=Salvia miltiorrhiza TaxID=226208 RepID=UPI0025ABA201|nr:uncharacterized protein LOC131010288 isoform X2 [Salvia miltiorrhiza]